MNSTRLSVRCLTEDLRFAIAHPNCSTTLRNFANPHSVICNSKNIFPMGKGMIGFQKGINLIFSLFHEVDKKYFLRYRYENELFIHFHN